MEISMKKRTKKIIKNEITQKIKLKKIKESSNSLNSASGWFNLEENRTFGRKKDDQDERKEWNPTKGNLRQEWKPTKEN